MSPIATFAETTVKQRLAGLLLLFGTGVVGTVAYALISSGGDAPATPAALNPPAGTGTVIGATPSPGVTATPAGVFTISGSVAGLVPGAAKTMALTIANPNPWPIKVLTVRTGVAVPASVSCPADTLAVGDYAFESGDAALTAPAGGTVRVDVPVELRDSLTADQTACAGAPLTITYSAS